jgi:hypothetical protein
MSNVTIFQSIFPDAVTNYYNDGAIANYSNITNICNATFNTDVNFYNGVNVNNAIYSGTVNITSNFFSNNNSTGVSSLSSIVSYSLSTLYSPYGISSLSSIVSYGLSTVYSPYGVSSLSSILSYGLSSLRNEIMNSNTTSYGISSLSSIVSYGLSTVYSPYGVSSLSSIVSYGLSSLGGAAGVGVSSLSSIVSYGLSTVAAQPHTGVSSLSSIVSYGLSSLGGAAGAGVSSLSSIVSYGLSTVARQPHTGVSSLSSIVSYGLSTVAAQPHTGVSSLSSIVSYGLSSLGGAAGAGVSSLSSIVSYGLSTVAGQPHTGVSSLSSIVSYGLSTIQVNIIQNITNNIVTSNIQVSGQIITSLYNRIVLVDSDRNLKLYIDDAFVSQYRHTQIMYSVHNNNQLIVAVGDNGSILYSRNGSNWNSAINPRPSSTLWSITYANGYWVATGSGGGNCLIYSRDGINWIQNPYNFPYTLNTIAYNSNSNYWVVGGQNSFSQIDGDKRNTLYKINNITTNSVTIATSGGLGHRANMVMWGEDKWVATGKSHSNTNKKVVYSYDGLNWSDAAISGTTDNFFGNTPADEGNGLAYGDERWLVGGSNNLYRSPNGIIFTDITGNIGNGINGGVDDSFPDGYEIYDIKYQSNNTFYVTVRSSTSSGTNYILKTTDRGTSWSKISESNCPQIYRLGVGSGNNPLSNINNVIINNGDLYTSNIYNSFNINTTTLFAYDISVTNTIITDTLIVNNIPLVSYGLSTVAAQPHFGLSSLSSIVSYGLSTVIAGALNPGVSSLSSIISYGLSTVAAQPHAGVSSLSSIVSYGLSTVAAQPHTGVSSLSSIVSYGLSTVAAQPHAGVSSLSSIVSYGLSTVARQPHAGVSSLSSIVSYGLSTVAAQPHAGVSSLSSIVSYGLSTVARQPHAGVSSLSSIVSYGLSTVAGQPHAGVSSLSSIISYGLSTVAAQPHAGVSSLSSIVSYGLSTVAAQPHSGVSSLSSIVSYGLSTVAAQPHSGVSSLSSIVSYGLSSVSIIGNEVFKPHSIGGIGISSTNCNIGGADLITTAFKKTDDWLFNNIVGKPPAPIFASSNRTKQYFSVSWSNPILYSIGLLDTYIPKITSLLVTLSNVTVPADTIYNTPIINIVSQSNLPMYATPIQGVDIYNTGTFNSIISRGGINYRQAVNNSIVASNRYNVYVSFSNFNINQNIPMNTLMVPNLQLELAGVPSVPRNATAVDILPRYRISLIWEAPTSNDIGDPNAVANGVNISNYRIVWSNISFDNFPRRFTGGRDTTIYNPVTVGSSTTSYDITGLSADNAYSVSISARNQLNTDYGAIAVLSPVTTRLPIAGALLTSGENSLVSYHPSINTYRFTISGRPANSRNSGPFTILDSNRIRNASGLSFQPPDLGIQTDSSPGITIQGDIMRIIGSNDLNSSVFLSNGGWTDSGDRTVSSCNMTISRTNIADVYPSGSETGFFQKATYRFTISNALLIPRQSPYTFFLTQSNFNNAFRTQTNRAIYVDTINGPPSIHAVSYNGIPPTPTEYICGVVSYTNGVSFTNFLNISNLGTYYLAQNTINNEFVRYSISTGSTERGTIEYARATDTAGYTIYNTANDIYSEGILPNPARIRTTITLLDTNFTAYTSTSCNLSLTARAVNLCNVGTDQTNTLLYGNSNFYVDLPSILVISQTLSVLNSNGARVTADGTEIIPRLANIVQFNNSNSLMISPYLHELQLVNGFYSTSNYSIDAYRDYRNFYCNTVNYSSPGNGTRYVMLSYSNTTSYTSIEKLKFRFTYGPQGNFPIILGDSFNRFDSNITLQYKFISSSKSTGWLNGNASVSGFNNAYPDNYTLDGKGGLNEIGTTSTDRVLQIPTGDYNSFQIYIRVGIPMILRCAFSYLSFVEALGP